MTRFCLIYIAVSAFVVLAPLVVAQGDGFPVLEGSYLGQKPPGTTPEVFAPGIISVQENFEHSAAVFSPDGSEVYWCTNVDFYTEQGQQGMLRLYFMNLAEWERFYNFDRPHGAIDKKSLTIL
jgi:hypothetical protein